MNDTAPAHSKLSPSKAYQWTTCTASIGYCADNKHRLPGDVSTPAAVEGTKAHNVAEACVLGLPMPEYATKEMIRFGQAYAEMCLDHRGAVSQCHDWGVERRVPLIYLPQEKGTVDFFAFNERGLFVDDYKYGYGKVEGVRNKQMASYAASLITYESGWIWPVVKDSTPVTMTIRQPRLPVDTLEWRTTWGELREFVADEIVAPALRILRGDKGVFAPDDHTCKFCPAESFCEARREWLLRDLTELAEPLMNDEDFPEATMLTDEKLVMIWERRKAVVKWLESIEVLLHNRKVKGHHIPGVRFVASNGGHRYWTDQQKAARLLTTMGVADDDVWVKKIVSPAQADKLVGHIKDEKVGRLHALMAKPPGKPVLVSSSDPRPDFSRALVESDFADLVENSGQDEETL